MQNRGWLNSPEEIEIETLLFTNKDSHEIVLPEGGGQAIRFTKK